MAVAKKAKTARGRKQDRARVAGGQNYEVRHEAKKTGKSPSEVRTAVKQVGNSRTKVEGKLHWSSCAIAVSDAGSKVIGLK